MTQWVLCFWLVSCAPGVGSCRHRSAVSSTDMEQSRTQPSGRKSRWPTRPADARMTKTPTWLRSLSLHRQEPSNGFVLPKLPGKNGFHLLEEWPSSESNNNDGLKRVVLPPLSLRSPSPAGGSGWISPDKVGSWLLPSFPSAGRQEAYRKESRQLSAKQGRLPPLRSSSPPDSTSSSSYSVLPHVTSSSAPPPRSPRGVEGTSVMLLSSRSRARMEDDEEKGEVKTPATADSARHHNERRNHVWAGLRDDSDCTTSISPHSDVFEQNGDREVQEVEELDEEEIEEEEEVDDERAGKGKVALATVALSGHRAPVDENQEEEEEEEEAGLLQAESRDPQPQPTTLTALQWTIEWTPRADVPDYSPPLSDADEIDDEMAAPWTAERHWRSARVRHSPPPVATPSAASPPRAPASPPVPALRAKTAHPSMSIELRHDDDDDNDEIVEEIEHIFDEFDMDCRVSSSRFREEDNDYVTPFVKSPPNLAAPDRPLFGVPVEQLKKYLNNPGEATNNNDEQDESKMTSSSPAFRRNPSEQILAAPDCLPNAVLHPDDRPVGPAGRHPRVVHSPVETRRAVYDMEFTDYDAVEADIDDMDVDNLRLPVKSRSVASFGTSPSPDENARRQRSLPTRRHDGINNGDKPTFNGVKKMAVMPSSIVNRKPTGLPSSSSSQAIAPKLAAGKQPEPLDPKTNLQISLKNINSSDWEDKIEGIKRLEELTVTNNDAVVPELHMIVLALIVEVKNLRSQVSRAAIQCMGKMFQHCGKYMEQDLDRTVPLLLNKAGDTNRFIRDDAHTALMNVTEYVSAPKAIVVIVTEGLSHKSATVRAEAAKLLASIVIKMGPAKVLSGAKDVTERILPAAAHFIQDGSLEARAQAKTIFSVLINDPVFEKAMQKYLSPNVIRNIQRTLDQLRKNIR